MAEKIYTLKLKGQRAIDAVYKIGDGQNTSDGGDDTHETGYHLGSTRWYQMARDRVLVLNERDLDWTIDNLEVHRDGAWDCAQTDYDAKDWRAKGNAYDRLRTSLIKLKIKAGA